MTCYYFYLWDEDFGGAFIKVCAYFPYPARAPSRCSPSGGCIASRCRSGPLTRNTEIGVWYAYERLLSKSK